MLLLIIGASVLISQNSHQPVDYAKFKRAPIVNLSKEIDFNNYNLDTVLPADENTGNLPDKIEGSRDAKILIFEYADYSCSHCAEQNAALTSIVDDYGGDVAVVYRTLVLSFPNSVSSASAATAAAIQGYWEKYKNLLFSNQASWYALTGDARDNYFGQLFVQASDGAGDLDQFYADYRSEAVAKRLAFNYGAADFLGIDATPHFRINGEKVLASDLRTKLDELLGK